MDSELLIVPRGTEFVGTAPNSQPGIRWKAKYGFAGLNQKAVPSIVADGMNEQGLVVGLLYMPGFAQFETPSESQFPKTLGPWEVANFLLSQCATVKEAKSLMQGVHVAQVAPPALGNFVVPLHYYISDKSGSVLIVEYVDGKRKMYDNPLGVLTNSPPFDWQLNNLSNYVNLSPMNVPSLVLNRWTVNNYGQGSGMLGLPGDFTPPSRFVRAALFSQWAEKQSTAIGAVNLGFHILNSFDLFDGIIRLPAQTGGRSLLPPGEIHSDTTEWVVVNDQTNRVIYYRSYGSLSIQMIDLKGIDFQKGGMRLISLPNAFTPQDITANQTPFKEIK
jgi:choloylglycine hydrolase